MKQTVVFDFDGVIHSYKSGWKGATIIPDPPVDGIADALKKIKEAGYEIVIVSTRCCNGLGRLAIQNWLNKNEMGACVDKICSEKPPAICYVDDRAICFDGNADRLLATIQSFKPWYQREAQASAPSDLQLAQLGDPDAAQRLADQDLLLPCLSCGKPVEVVQVGGGWFWRHAEEENADRCVLSWNLKYKTKQEAIAAWNSRAKILSDDKMQLLHG